MSDINGTLCWKMFMQVKNTAIGLQGGESTSCISLCIKFELHFGRDDLKTLNDHVKVLKLGFPSAQH